MRSVLLILLLTSLCYAESIVRSPSEVDQKEFLEISEKAVSELKKQASQTDKLKLVRKLDFKVQSTRKEVSKRLEEIDKKNADGKFDSEREKLEKREEEVIFWQLAFERVHQSTLDPKFQKSAAYKKKVCTDLPHSVKFDEVVHQPEGAELSPYRKLALELLAEICK